MSEKKRDEKGETIDEYSAGSSSSVRLLRALSYLSVNELYDADILAIICLSSSVHVLSPTNTILIRCLIRLFFSFH